jgi:hypothetical protein
MYRPPGSCLRQTGGPACRAPVVAARSRHIYRTRRSSRRRLPHEQARIRPGGAGARSSCQDAAPRERLGGPASDEPPPAGFDAGQGAAPHLVLPQAAGHAGQAGGLIGAVRQPFGRWIWSWRAPSPGRDLVVPGCGGDVSGVRRRQRSPINDGQRAITIRNEDRLRHACRPPGNGLGVQAAGERRPARGGPAGAASLDPRRDGLRVGSGLAA